MSVPGHVKVDSGPIPPSGLSGAHPPGTTPLVAMALMEMAVSKVCGKEGLGEQLSWVGSGGRPWPCPSWDTHTAAANEHNEEGLQHTGRAHHPGQPQEEDNPEDILQAGQVHPHEGAHAGCLWSRTGKGRQSIRGAQMLHGRPAPSHLTVPRPQGVLPENRLQRDIPSGVLGSAGGKVRGCLC